MASKDIKKRREAYKRWVHKNKEKRREYQRILWISRKSNPIPQICSIVGCTEIGERHHEDYNKPDEIVWICRYHHRRVKHTKYEHCLMCESKVLARGLCNKHYKSERKKIDPEYALRVKESLKKSNKKRYCLES